ncbi:NUDIX hydrolase [Paenibacillus mesophilus]|uniref:NUDIX domain-containing protein n=1 Tax=Paenibacillus mesophilus TaxID=2582849 RepID=UPI00110E4D63|nr:NUDIX hydrolase [Paenibacillus mesophilus]TMV50311.1 NUDIX hydrolase [Paenibacillus mesophilus]
MNKPLSAGAGGVLLQSGNVLLVQVNYGANKGLWMLPGGFVEPGESIEQAGIREFMEETGLDVTVKRIVGIRSGVRESSDGTEAGIYIVFEMEYRSGDIRKDDREIAACKYWNVEEALQSDVVIDLTKQFIESALCSNGGLSPGRTGLKTKTTYKTYEYYKIIGES